MRNSWRQSVKLNLLLGGLRTSSFYSVYLWRGFISALPRGCISRWVCDMLKDTGKVNLDQTNVNFLCMLAEYLFDNLQTPIILGKRMCVFADSIFCRQAATLEFHNGGFRFNSSLNISICCTPKCGFQESYQRKEEIVCTKEFYCQFSNIPLGILESKIS